MRSKRRAVQNQGITLNLSLGISEAALSCDLFNRDNVAKDRSWPKYKSFFRNIYDML